MNITGLLVHAWPGQLEAVRAHLAQLPGVEVHAATDDGRLVVTVEQERESEAPPTFDRVQATPGVHAVALVYHHSEPIAEATLAEKESKP